MRTIGIAGPSCSGTTTLAGLLAEALDAQAIDADRTYIKGSTRPVVAGEDGWAYESFERPDLYDLASIARALDDVARSGRAGLKLLDWKRKDYCTVELTDAQPIIVEGFAIYTEPALAERLDQKYWIEVPVDESIRRRLARGGRRSDESYRQIARSERHLIAGQRSLEGVTVLDGTRAIDELFDELRSREG